MRNGVFKYTLSNLIHISMLFSTYVSNMQNINYVILLITSMTQIKLVRLDEEVHHQLKAFTAAKGFKTLSNAIRELLENARQC